MNSYIKKNWGGILFITTLFIASGILLFMGAYDYPTRCYKTNGIITNEVCIPGGSTPQCSYYYQFNITTAICYGKTEDMQNIYDKDQIVQVYYSNCAHSSLTASDLTSKNFSYLFGGLFVGILAIVMLLREIGMYREYIERNERTTIVEMSPIHQVL